VLLSVPISYHFHGCTALLVALVVVVSGAILNTHLYLLPLPLVFSINFHSKIFSDLVPWAEFIRGEDIMITSYLYIQQ